MSLKWTYLAAALCAALVPPLSFAAASPEASPVDQLLIGAARAGDSVVAVGEWGTVLRSVDAGRHWRAATVPTDETLTDVYFADAVHGWAVGHHGAILATEDGGQQWADRRLVDRSVDPLLGVYFFDGTHGFAVGAFGTLLESVDGGRTFQRRDIGQGDGHLKAVAGNAAGELYIASEEGVIFRSADRGRSFERAQTGYRGSFWGLALLPGAVLAYGMRGTVYRSEDGGHSWASVPTGSQSGLSAACVFDARRVVIAGAEGTVLESRDAGRSFAPAERSDHAAITALACLRGGALLIGRAPPTMHEVAR
ncbi:YCF48-related protein [Variovorax sp. J22P271]|uniref:WD40/YVTN/BNR-like repeat-containing protein n=1 Tax=Variovorax davisae TaxID=3053515 RepID=UPI0025776FA0|nr:YCF48-related protein [Variovorax sp. J22P271]MDM0032393.1 YCF48-related protein [Variovorax sp. J22P271]